jgi:hypothetical protein
MLDWAVGFLGPDRSAGSRVAGGFGLHPGIFQSISTPNPHHLSPIRSGGPDRNAGIGTRLLGSRVGCFFDDGCIQAVPEEERFSLLGSKGGGTAGSQDDASILAGSILRVQCEKSGDPNNGQF